MKTIEYKQPKLIGQCQCGRPIREGDSYSHQNKIYKCLDCGKIK